ncbi:polysaccharide biosynthesis/export family protein [Flavobacterium sp. H122]|uniref:polysaccharide biosynthesis/export family protein n=1 Tax=Flavobacterium sp. H122 TaxID=2529860 RepID=UPI0010AA7BDD|nr:polysaccharide biosynthesis/export family protein [Flavobacterium sp. H122]
MIKFLKLVCFIVFLNGIWSCGQQKKIAYYQDIDSFKDLSGAKFESKFQPDDLLMIIVSAPDPEAAAPFNLSPESVATPIGQSAAMSQRQHMLYLIDKEGKIEFPILGTIDLMGKTKNEAINILKGKLLQYVKNPIINIRVMNYKVSVQGEVTRPGAYPITSERITLLEALSLAGDLTIYGKRQNVLIIREIDGKKTVGRVDLTKSDFMNSPYYYLVQNDVVYVEPNGAKSNSSTFNQNIPVWVSLSSVLISLVLLFKK